MARIDRGGKEGGVGHVDGASTGKTGGAQWGAILVVDTGKRHGMGGAAQSRDLTHAGDLGGLILGLQDHDTTFPAIWSLEASALPEQVGFETFAKVKVAKDGLNEGDETHEEGDEGEDGEIVLDIIVLFLPLGIGPDTDGLEEKVGNGAEKADHEGKHHVDLLTTYGIDGGQENEDDDGEGDDGEGKFGVVELEDEHYELDGESDEKEDIEFQEHEEDVVGTVHALLADVGTDLFVDSPAEFLEELPGEPEKGEFGDPSDDNDDDERGLKSPVWGVISIILGARDIRVGHVNLRELETGVEEAACVEEDDAEDLDGVLTADGVPDEDALHDLGEDEDHEVDGDAFRGAIVEGGGGGKVVEEDGFDGDDDGGLSQGKEKGDALEGGLAQERGHWGEKKKSKRGGGSKGERSRNRSGGTVGGFGG